MTAPAVPRTSPSAASTDLSVGTGALALLGDADRLVPFNPAILAVRWATTMVCVTLAAEAFIERDYTVIPWVMGMVANTLIRTVSPLSYTGSVRSLLDLLLEVGITVLAVCLTGFWSSPLVFTLLVAAIIAGFARGFAFGIRVAASSAITVSLTNLAAEDWSESALLLSARWSTVLVLIGVVAGYARRISGEANRQHTLALDRLSRLADANALLSNLHRVAQTLPASLDLNEVLDSTLARLRGLVKTDAAVILTREDIDGTWTVARKQSMAVTGSLTTDELPTPAQAALTSRRVLRQGDLAGIGPGFNPGSQSGIYAPLVARGSLVGLLVVESRNLDEFTERDREVVKGFIEPVSLAIDNARWFARIKTVSADEERTRIARDLHDSIGQSLAYLGFELDRIVKREDEGEPISDQLDDLRRDLRGVVSEVRDTLYDLRTDVGVDKDFAETMEEFASRVSERTGMEIAIHVSADAGNRLPILQEREMWRIAQEALINCERHADARRVDIAWHCSKVGAQLEVTDNGRGFAPAVAGRVDSYGIRGMRERASSVGATFEITSAPGEGTRVRCILARNS
jgi:signal transduction histidine kinase